MSKVIPIEVTRGDTEPLTFRITEKGKPVDISSWSAFYLTIDPAQEPTDGTTKVEQITGALTAGGTDGRVSFQPAGTTDAGDYFYDAQGTTGAGKKRTFAKGKFKIVQDITKL